MLLKQLKIYHREAITLLAGEIVVQRAKLQKHIISCLSYTASKTIHHHLMKVRDEPKCHEDYRGEKKIKKESGRPRKN